jgi:glycosyl transferase family 25
MNKYIDKIIYINLNRRTDRRKLIETELNAFELKYERFEAIDTPGFGILGCGLSHLAVLKIARDHQYTNILILEDDFTFEVTKGELEQRMVDFFELNLQYNVLMLSYLLCNSEPTPNTFLLKITEAQTASGYIVHSNYYDKLINLYEHAMTALDHTREHWIYANDQIWKQYQKTDIWFGFIPRIGKQTAGFSDNAQRYHDYNF